MKKLYTITLALAVLLLIAAGVNAQQLQRTYINGMQSDAHWYQPGTNGYDTYTDLFVTKTCDGNTIIDLYFNNYDASGTPHYWSGELMTRDNVYDMSKKLDSASLSAVPIAVQDWDTGNIETITVKADWTGMGDSITEKFSDKSNSKSGSYSIKADGTFRAATVTGSITEDSGVNNLGISNLATMIKFKTLTVIKN